MNQSAEHKHPLPGSHIPLTKDSIAEDMIMRLDTAVAMLGQFWESRYSSANPPTDYVDSYNRAATEIQLIYTHLSMLNDVLQAAYDMPSPYFKACLETMLDS